MDYLEQLLRQWYEYQGYFVRSDLWVGLQSDGTYDCELDIVAFHPVRRHVVHIEPSYELLASKDTEQHFQTKFDAGKKYLHRLFGLEDHLHIEQYALIVGRQNVHWHTIGGGRIVMLPDFLSDILQRLSGFGIANSMIPEQWPLILTLQWVSEYRGQIAPLLGGQPESTGASPPAR